MPTFHYTILTLNIIYCFVHYCKNYLLRNMFCYMIDCYDSRKWIEAQCCIVTWMCFLHTAMKTIVFCYLFVHFLSVLPKSLIVSKWNISIDIVKHFYAARSSNSIVSIVTRLGAGRSRICGSVPSNSKRFFSPLSSAKVKNKWICTSTSPICHHGMDRDNIWLYLLICKWILIQNNVLF